MSKSDTPGNTSGNTSGNMPSRDAIQRVVQRFYQKLMQDPQLSPFFSHIEDFSEHEQRISDFWYMSMGGRLEQPPKIDMIGKHFPLGIKTEDLQHWLALFSETLGEELPQQQALMWMDKAMTIAARMQQIVIENQAMGVQIKQSD
jgi:hemoglobin